LGERWLQYPAARRQVVEPVWGFLPECGFHKTCAPG